VRLSLRDYFPKALNLFFLIIFAFMCTYPLYFVFINAFSNSDAITKGVFLIPGGFTFLYFKQVFEVPDVLHSIFISVARTVVGTVLTVFCSSLLGYMVTKNTLPFRKIIYRLVIITMYFNAGLIPWYILMKNLGLKNNFLLYVLPGAVAAFFVILVKTYVESIPPSLEESAELDGAGTMTIFFKLIIPLCLPVIACVSVFCAVGQWNAWADNLYLVTNPNLTTLQYLLYSLLQSNMAMISNHASGVGGAGVGLGPQHISPAGLRYAMTVVTVVPIILVYPFMQRYFVKGIMLGAVKG
jgi:putative aldouronate transport system permease protein